MGKSKLTPKQRKFCNEYMLDLNATQAAIRAGYSKRTAMEQGYQLLQKTSVQEYLSKLKQKVEDKYNITQDSLIREITSDQELARNLKQTATAMKGSELKGKLAGLLTDKVVVSGKLTLEQIVAARKKK